MKKIFIIPLLILIFSCMIYSQDTRSLNVVVKQLGDKCQVGKQYLFLIAINRYEHWFPLKNPVKDAKEIRDILISRYFIDEVIELYDADATKSGIIKSFNELQKTLKPHDSLLVFYAGHGYLDEVTNSGYWIPINAGIDSFEQVNWLSNAQIRGMLSSIKASHILLISDSCFSGDILDTTRSSVPEISHDYFRKAYSRVSRQVLTSGASESVPDRSEFARQLKLILQRNMYTYLDPLMIYNEIRLGISQTLPLLGNLKGTGHQDGAGFILFLKEEINHDKDENKKNYFDNKVKKEYGNISLTAITGGDLFIDGDYKNTLSDTSELLIIDIQTGVHTLEMKYKSGKKEEKEVIVKKDTTINVNFKWKYTFGFMKITVNQGGSLFINNVFHKAIEPETTLIRIETGEYLVKLVYKEGNFEKRNVKVEEEQYSLVRFLWRKPDKNIKKVKLASFDDNGFGGHSKVTRCVLEGSTYILAGNVKRLKLFSAGWIGMHIILTSADYKNLLRQAKGIKFKAKGNLKEYICSIPTSSIKDNGNYYAIFSVDDQGKEISILFSDLKQPQWAKRVAFNERTIYAIRFSNTEKPVKNYSFYLEISDLQFILE